LTGAPICRCLGHNDRVDIGEVLGAVNVGLGGGWQLERRLAGGWNEGAYLLVRGGGSRAVLKWRASDPERLLGARELVEVARARGWPAPKWLATGQAATGEAWVVQEFIDGRTPPRLDDFVAEQMTWILGLQEAMFPGGAGGWGQWAAGVVFEDWGGLRDRVASGVPGGSRIVAAVDAIAGACPRRCQARTWCTGTQPGQHHRHPRPAVGGRRRGPWRQATCLRPG
jgi:hypothetical protein